jgi:RNase P subunit RPR2
VKIYRQRYRGPGAENHLIAMCECGWQWSFRYNPEQGTCSNMHLIAWHMTHSNELPV